MYSRNLKRSKLSMQRWNSRLQNKKQEAERLDKEEEKYWIQYNEYQKTALGVRRRSAKVCQNLVLTSSSSDCFYFISWFVITLLSYNCNEVV